MQKQKKNKKKNKKQKQNPYMSRLSPKCLNNLLKPYLILVYKNIQKGP